MFGYVVANEPELRIREFHLYRSYYCGLCMELKNHYGQIPRLTLSYDTTFLALLLTSLYEPEDRVSRTRCIAHPFEIHPTRQNEYTRYAADINVLLSYHSCMDDWQDERRLKKRIFAALLSGPAGRAAERQSRKADVIMSCLKELHEVEKGSGQKTKGGVALLDKAGGIFGRLMAEIFDVHEDLWSEPLRRMGFNLGKFIYILDAYDDMEKDAASGSFNPLLSMADRKDLDEYLRDILNMLMAECSRAFEMLPVVENVEILRNILYCGIWSGFEKRYRARKTPEGESCACSECPDGSRNTADADKSMKEVSDNE